MEYAAFDENEFDSLATGHVQVGSIHFSWDFTDLIERRKRQERMSTGGVVNGRLIIPCLGIF